MVKRSVLRLLITVVFVFSLSACSYIDLKKYEPFTLWVYPTCKDDAYKIDVDGNKLKMITCYRKDMDGFDVSKIVEQKEAKLSSKETKQIYDIVEKIHKNDSLDNYESGLTSTADGWLLRFEYKNKTITFDKVVNTL
ncbi:MAG: hypothetical protein Q4D76_19615 [Oscillospiraceae bacterium]|nr:hypothetical protein [Oscillospiraceae bacterium]